MGIHVYFFKITNEKIIEIKDDKDKIRKFLKEQMSIKNNPREQWTEKAWEGIHYLLYNKKWFDKKQWEYGTLLYGHVLNPNIYEGYGSPLVQDEQEVEKICKHLTSFSKEDLRKKYNPKQFTKLDIYPFGERWESDPEYYFDYLLYHWEGLCKFYQEAVDNNELVLVYWS